MSTQTSSGFFIFGIKSTFLPRPERQGLTWIGPCPAPQFPYTLHSGQAGLPDGSGMHSISLTQGFALANPFAQSAFPSCPSLSWLTSPLIPLCWEVALLNTLSKPCPHLLYSLFFSPCIGVELLPILFTWMETSRRQRCVCFVYRCFHRAGALGICWMNWWMNSKPFKTWEWEDHMCVLHRSLQLQCGGCMYGG